MTKARNRFARKLDAVLWFLLTILPLIAYFVSNFHNPSATDFIAYSAQWEFPFVSTILGNVLDTVGFNNIPIVPLLSYMVGVEIVHLFFDFIVFIPRLAHTFMGRLYLND